MLGERHFLWLKNELLDFFKKRKTEIFLFGSGVNRKNFGDLDVALKGDIKETDLLKLKERFEESTFPYIVDFVNLNEVEKSFKKNISSQKKIWIKH